MKLMIPKTEHLDPSVSEELISFFVFGSLIGKAVSAAIQFHSQLGKRAIKVEEVNTARILAAEFEFGKAAVAQQTPQALFSIRGFFPQVAREVEGCRGAGAMFAVAWVRGWGGGCGGGGVVVLCLVCCGFRLPSGGGGGRGGGGGGGGSSEASFS